MPRGGFAFGRPSGEEALSGRIDIIDNFIAKQSFPVSITSIAGGAAGGSIYYAGGGGAGGMLDYSTSLQRKSYSIEIGAGGASNGAYGSDTQAFGETIYGGGPGNVYQEDLSKQVGSGGGHRAGDSSYSAQGTSGQGFPGGAQGSNGTGGGGGGAGEAGSTDGHGHGGDGRASSINGVVYAGGGGGAMNANVAYSINPGGSGGGGNAAADYLGTAVQAQNGTANTGGGGGGSCWGNTTVAGRGGSGRVMVKYPSYVNSEISNGLVSSVEQDGDYQIVTITGGIGTITFS